MATRRYMANPQEVGYQVTEAVGAANVTKRVEVNVDWDALLSDGLSGQSARLSVINNLYAVIEYIEQTGKFNVKA